MKKQQIIDNFIIKEFKKNNVKDWFIIQNNENSYLLFNKFEIVRKKNYYNIYQFTNSEVQTFYSLKNAVTWCIFENLSKYSEAYAVKNLDYKIESLTFNELYHKKLFNNCKELNQKILYFIKHNEDKKQKILAEEQIESYINTSRYWLHKKLKSLMQ